jgi:hypothetical protein
LNEVLAGVSNADKVDRGAFPHESKPVLEDHHPGGRPGHPLVRGNGGQAQYGYGEFIVALGYKERLTAEGQLMAYRHEGYWQPMDKVRKRNLLESLWQTRHAPWKVWP